MADKSLILLRGLPGSGKTTFASLLQKTSATKCFSLDSYFTDESGIYAFDYKMNHLAYKECQNKVENAMAMGEITILVDQTFALMWEMEPYIDLASKYGYRLFVCTLENRHNGKNSHGITDEQILKMAKGFKVELIPEYLRRGEKEQ